MGHLITNPPGVHRAASVNGVLKRIAADRGLRDTIPGQLTHAQQSANPNPKPHYGGYRPDVFCWCQTKIVRSTFDRIARGLTESCGAPYCKEPE